MAHEHVDNAVARLTHLVSRQLQLTAAGGIHERSIYCCWDGRILVRIRDTATMGDDRAADLVAHARELDRRDIDVTARIDVAVGVLRRVDEVRMRAGCVRAALAATPGEVAHAEQAAREAQTRETEARRELTEAEGSFETVGRSRRVGEDARADAERAVRRAAVAAADAATTLARMQERLTVLAAEEAALLAERAALAFEAREVAQALADLPRLSGSGRTAPGASLEEIEAWGARAHAALFVVRGGLENERERIVAEANTLAATALGEQVGGASVALVRKRLEESLSGA